MTPSTQTPPVTVLVCTRDRGDSIAITIQSILACTYPDFTLVVVDQSSDLSTERALASFCHEPRLRYLSTTTHGLSLALNIGLTVTTTDLAIITDDDCEVPPNWITEMVAPFMRYPQVGLVFCDVTAAPHDYNLGFIPVSISPNSFLIEDLAHWQTNDGVNIGIGAGMAVRRRAAEAIGGFDTNFGAGSRFRSGNDLDFTLRMLAAGYQIYRTHAVGVIHYGFRTHSQVRRLIRNNMFSIGGICGQMIRRGYLLGLRYYTTVFARLVISFAMKELLRRRMPPVLGRVVWLIRGMLAGLLTTPRKPRKGLIGIPER